MGGHHSSEERLPFERGTPPAHTLCPAGTPPFGLDAIGAVQTVAAWLVPCPCCVVGRTPLLPDGTRHGYRLAHELGCSRGCEPSAVAWWAAWRSLELPPAEPVGPVGERAGRYGLAVLRGELGRLLDSPPADRLEGLRAVAYKAGRYLDAAGLDPLSVAAALLEAARRLGLDPAAVKDRLADAVDAGRASPAEVPAE